MVYPYYVHLHKTAAILFNQNVYAIDDNLRIHNYSVQNKKWNIVDEALFNWI